MADVCQGKDRFTAVAFTAGYGGDSSGGGNGGESGIPNAVLADPIYNQVPVNFWASPIMRIVDKRLGRFPCNLCGIVDAVFDGREG